MYLMISAQSRGGMVKTCFRAPRVLGSGAFGVTPWFGPHTLLCNLRFVWSGWGWTCIISVLCVMTMHMSRCPWAIRTKNLVRFLEQKTRCFFCLLVLSWITRRSYLVAYPKKNTQKNTPPLDWMYTRNAYSMTTSIRFLGQIKMTLFLTPLRPMFSWAISDGSKARDEEKPPFFVTLQSCPSFL
jgi:hypothetical protein